MKRYHRRRIRSFALCGLLLLINTVTNLAFSQLTKMGDELTEDDIAMIQALAPNAPLPKADELVHIPPSIHELDQDDDLHPKMKEAILRGHDLFINTQQLRGENIFNNLTCASCHMGEGRLPFAGPVWPAAIDLPNYRGKNDHVNSLEERIVGCFTFSMNGQPPAYGSDDMLAISLYLQWLAKGVAMYPEAKIYGRGYPRLPEPEMAPERARGQIAYEENCALCHGINGAGVVESGEVIFPTLWGDASYNWGAGISRIFTMASFIKHNMPLGLPNTISDQEAWDIAQYINTQERPQDPRYTGDIKETLALYSDTFHKHTMYGQEVEGKILGDHNNTGEKDFLMPQELRPRDFSTRQK